MTSPSSEVRYSWTQPSCEGCWFGLNPARDPVRMKVADVEHCVFCGHETTAGIYVRIDPAEARHPTLEK